MFFCCLYSVTAVGEVTEIAPVRYIRQETAAFSMDFVISIRLRILVDVVVVHVEPQQICRKDCSLLHNISVTIPLYMSDDGKSMAKKYKLREYMVKHCEL